MSRSDVEVVRKLNQILGKFEQVMGIRIFGVDAAGNPVAVRVTSDGKLRATAE